MNSEDAQLLKESLVELHGSLTSSEPMTSSEAAPAAPSREEAGGEGSIEEWLGQVWDDL